jgi:phosphoglycolate phosphatase
MEQIGQIQQIQKQEQLDAIIFDLDGTLWDTCSSCATAWNEVVRRRGIAFRAITAEDVRLVTGKPHDVCVRETFVGLPEEQIRCLIEETMIEDNRVIEDQGGDLYPGVLSGLKALHEYFPLFIVSNCQTGYIETFLRFTGMEGVFRDFECWGRTGKSKSENLADIINRNNLKAPVFIGDSEGDRVAARDCRVPFFFVEYGFGQVIKHDGSFPTFGHLTDVLISRFRPLSARGAVR